MKNIIICLIAVLTLSGCKAMFYGQSTSIELASPVGTDEKVDISVTGVWSDFSYHDVTLPFKIKMKRYELPLKVSVASSNYLYEDLFIDKKEVGEWLYKAWLVPDFIGTGTMIGSLIPILADPEGDHQTALKIVAISGAIGLVSACAAGFSPTYYGPQYHKYELTPVDSTSSRYSCLLLNNPVIHYNDRTGNKEIVQGNVIYSYTNDSCQLSTADGIIVIPYDRGYSDIKYVQRQGYEYYTVEKSIGGRTYYGACDMTGIEMVAPQKKRPSIFGVNMGLKAKEPLANLENYICKDHRRMDASQELNKSALALIEEQRYDEALNKLRWSVYMNRHEMNDAYYLLGHYFCFGTFGQEALNDKPVDRIGSQPVDSVKGMEYLNMSLSSYTADVFADRNVWMYNPEKAIRLYADYSGIIGDIRGESVKIGEVFQRDRNFIFDVNYYFLQKYSEFLNDSTETVNVDNLVTFLPLKLDTIVAMVDKIPIGHKSAALNLTNLDEKDLFLLGMKNYNEKQFGQALYYFRRGAHCGDENGYAMSIITLDSIARHYCKGVSNLEIADAFSNLWPYPDHTGRFTKQEMEFRNYYEQVYEKLQAEEKRREEQLEHELEMREEARRQRNMALANIIIGSISQGVQAYYNANSTKHSSTTTTPRKSALDTQLPEAFNPQRIAAMSKPVYTYDSNGNLMVSYPGFARALGEMNTEVQKHANEISNELMATGDPYYMAKAYGIRAEAHLQNDINQTDMMLWATPMYPEARMAAADIEEDSAPEADSDAQSKPTNRTDSKERASGKLTTSTSKTNMSKTAGTDNKGDAKQQFHQGTVNSSDYEVVKHNVTLFLRDGDKAKPYLHNKELCRKRATYYIKIDNKYYLVGYSNWGRFNRSIMYGAHSVYFDM